MLAYLPLRHCVKRLHAAPYDLAMATCKPPLFSDEQDEPRFGPEVEVDGSA